MTEELHLAGGMTLDRWLELVGRGTTTGWEWRKPGPNGEAPRIATVNIDGKKYVRAKAIQSFWDRAEAGEFAKVAVVPKRPKKG